MRKPPRRVAIRSRVHVLERGAATAAQQLAAAVEVDRREPLEERLCWIVEVSGLERPPPSLLEHVLRVEQVRREAPRQLEEPIAQPDDDGPPRLRTTVAESFPNREIGVRAQR